MEVAVGCGVGIGRENEENLCRCYVVACSFPKCRARAASFLFGHKCVDHAGALGQTAGFGCRRVAQAFDDAVLPWLWMGDRKAANGAMEPPAEAERAGPRCGAR